MPFKKILGTTILSVLLYFQIVTWQLPVLGWVILCLYFLFIYKGYYLGLVKIFGFSSNIYTKILGACISFFILGFLFAIFLFFNKFQNEIIALSFLINSLISIGFEKYFINHKHFKFDTKKVVYFPKIRSPFFRSLSFIYLALVGIGFYFLYISKTGESILTPWQTINPVYIYIFFFATLILGFLIFSKLKFKTILFLLILHSFLLHAYLPLTQEYFYGADQWRHTAVEGRILDGLPIEPSVEGESIELISNFNIGKLSYANFWGVSTFLSKTLQINLIDFNKWFLPILFSLIFPILLFELGRAFNWGRKESLFLVFVGFLPFALQGAGSMTLPISFGFLPFVLSLILIIKYLKFGKKEQLISLLILGILFLFGYSLYFILFWLSLFSACLFKNFYRNKRSILIVCIIAIFVGGSIVALEIFAGYSFWPVNWPVIWPDALKQIIGNFFAFYLATGPRPHDILIGNILFNQIPIYSYVQNIFNSQLWLVPILAFGFWLLAIWGIVKGFCKENKQIILITSLSIGLTISYIVSRYFLSGENILARRLDMVLGLLFVILFTVGLSFLSKKLTAYSLQLIVLFIFILSIGITISYSLGPDTNTVSKNKYQAMEFVWKNEKDNKNHCVFADTYALLSLEAISKKEIIGGGLPIDMYFSQTELQTLYSDILISDESEKVLENIREICESKNFWVLSDDNFRADKFGEDSLKRFDKFNDLFVWQINIK